MSAFGWSYPPGAELDPRAPWNRRDDDERNDERDSDDRYWDHPCPCRRGQILQCNGSAGDCCVECAREEEPYE